MDKKKDTYINNMNIGLQKSYVDIYQQNIKKTEGQSTNLGFCLSFFLAKFFFLKSLLFSFGLLISCITSYFPLFYL